MKFKISLLLILLLSSMTVSLGKDPVWLKKMKEVKILQSTWDDIRKIFGNPLDEKKSLGEFYDLEVGRLFVNYSSGLCVTKTEDGNTKVHGWMVPEGTVIMISLSLEKSISPKKLNVDLTKFTRTEVYDVPGSVIYEDEVTGVDYGVYQGKIHKVRFNPRKDQYNLHCK